MSPNVRSSIVARATTLSFQPISLVGVTLSSVMPLHRALIATFMQLPGGTSQGDSSFAVIETLHSLFWLNFLSKEPPSPYSNGGAHVGTPVPVCEFGAGNVMLGHGAKARTRLVLIDLALLGPSKAH